MIQPENLYTYRAKYIRNYDGDTVTLMVDMGMNTFRKMNIRLYDVDTPEIRSKDPADKELAYKAKQFTENFLKGKEILLKTVRDRTGKYGRYLGRIYVEGIELSKKLRVNGFDTGRRF